MRTGDVVFLVVLFIVGALAAAGPLLERVGAAAAARWGRLPRWSRTVLAALVGVLAFCVITRLVTVETHPL